MKIKTLNYAGAWCKKQLPTLLSGAAIIGVIITGILTAKASVKAKERLDQLEEPAISDKLKALTPIYVPSIVTGSVTIACILGANQINLKRYAALASTCAIAKSQLKAHKDKVLELFGKEKADEVEKEIAKDQVAQKAENLTFASDQLVTCKDLVTGMVFPSNMVRIQAAANSVNTMVLLDGTADLGDFYDQLNVEPPKIAESIRWRHDGPRPIMEIEFGGEITANGTPCLTFTYDWKNCAPI